MSYRPPLAVALTAVASTALATVLTAVPAQADGPHEHPTDPPWVTVASGLDNPRHLSISGHSLYVAEAGVGGSVPGVTSPEGEACFGLSGAITKIGHGYSRRVVTGLPSLAAAGGGGATGPTDVIVHRHRWAATIGLANEPSARDTLGEDASLLGTVVTGSLHSGSVRELADLAAYEEEFDPDGNGADSNPTGMAYDRGGLVVTDSGGNSLLRVRGGHIRTLAVFPNRTVAAPPPLPPGPVPMQSVPTSVIAGGDGAYYVSELTGFPFPPGESTIWRVVKGHAPTAVATGLTNVTDLAWHHGALYAVQISSAGLLNEPPGQPPTGSLVRITRGAAPTTVAEGLPAPYGVALHGDTAFVTTCAVCPDAGAVVAIDLD